MTRNVQIEVPIIDCDPPGHVGAVGTLPTETRLMLCRIACACTEQGVRLSDTGEIDTPTQVVRYLCEQVEAAEKAL